MKIAHLLAATALTSVALTAPGAAAAQTTAGQTTAGQTAAGQAPADVEPAPQSADADDARTGDILVTGSRVPRPEYEGVLPGVQVGAEQIETRGFTNAIDLINDIPLTGAGAGLAGNNGAGQPVALGAAFVDLLDLGTQRTLTLVNSRRFVSANAATLFAFGNETGGQVDVNSIPVGLVERVDVVTVGGAAAYGSDAIAGVVNFILKDSFQGTELTAISGISSRGDAATYNLRALHGVNFGGGRGNLAFSGEYSHIDAVLGDQRDFRSANPGFVPNFADGGIRNSAFAIGLPAARAFLASGTDLAPGNVGVDRLTSLAIAPGGAIFETLSTVAAQNGVSSPGASFFTPATQVVPGTILSAALAGCSTTLASYCNFAPSALPGTAAQQATFAQSVLTQYAPNFSAQGSQADRNTLALSILQNRLPTPREFLAQNPNVPVNVFLGAFIPGFVDVANTDTTPVTINGSTIPLNQLFPRVGVPLRFDDAGNVTTYAPGALNAATPSTLGQYAGPNGFFNPKTTLIRPAQDRAIANLIGHYDITDNITFFTENLYARVKAVTPYSAATQNLLTTSAETAAIVANVNNPYLDAGDRAALAAAGITAANRNGNFTLTRTNQDILGANPNTNTTETYRFVNGLRGDFELFGRKANWEVSGTYGKAKLSTTGSSIKDVEFALALDAVADPVTGQIRCRSQISGAPAVLNGVSAGVVRLPGADGIPTDQNFTPAATADVISACQPLNPFGFNQMSQAAKDYVIAREVTTNTNEQLFFQGLLDGDLFALPGGSLGYALNAEFRQEKLAIDANELGRLGRGRSAPYALTSGRTRTYEGGAELRIPIFGDDFSIPLFRTLEFNPAIRFTKQDGTSPRFRDITGRVIEPESKGDWETIYSLAGTWRPIRDITVRGNYTRSLRQPGIVELFLGNQPAFAAPTDPCSNLNITGSANPQRRQANCAAAVVSAGLAPNPAAAATFLNTFVANTASLQGAFAGSPDLRPERGTSWTAGAALSPRFIPGLTVSADYINLKLRDIIQPTTLVDALRYCYDSATFPDTSAQTGVNTCAFFSRGTDFQVAPGFASGYLNLAATRLEGVNISGTYGFGLPANIGRLSLRGNAFDLIRYDTSATGDFSDIAKSAGIFNRPKWEAVASARYDKSGFFTQLTWQWRDKTRLFSGGVPATAELANFLVYPSSSLYDLTVGADLSDRMSLQFTAINLTDETVAGSLGFYNLAYLDQLGRRFQVNAKIRF